MSISQNALCVCVCVTADPLRMPVSFTLHLLTALLLHFPGLTVIVAPLVRKCEVIYICAWHHLSLLAAAINQTVNTSP